MPRTWTSISTGRVSSERYDVRRSRSEFPVGYGYLLGPNEVSQSMRSQRKIEKGSYTAIAPEPSGHQLTSSPSVISAEGRIMSSGLAPSLGCRGTSGNILEHGNLDSRTPDNPG